MKDLQQDGGTAIYALFNSRCQELFRVIYNDGALHGSKVRPQGIITAYARPTSIPAILQPASSPDSASVYARQCPVIQDI